MNITKITSTKLAITFSLLLLVMSLTRGSHFLTPISLPDASFALFLIGGMLLKKPKWFSCLFVFSVIIDLVTLAMNNPYQIPINVGYLGLLPAYASMWFIGSYNTNTSSFFKFTIFGVIATLIAFLISTQTYNLFSGRFPNINITQSIQTGWEYLPQNLLYTMIYLMVYWGIKSLFKKQFLSQKATI